MSWLFRLNFIEVVYYLRTFVNVSGAENFVGSLMVLPMQVPKSKLIIIIMFVNNSFDDVLITTKKRLLAAMHFQIQMMMRMWCIYRRKENGTFVALCFNYCLSQSTGNLLYLSKEKREKMQVNPSLTSFCLFQAVSIMSKSLSDLVLGELQQMNGSKKNDPFESYLKKTYNKTASLMANSCQAVAHIAVQNCNYNFLSQGWFT